MQRGRKIWTLRRALARYRPLVHQALAVFSLLSLIRCLSAQSNSSDELLRQAQRLIEQGNLAAAQNELAGALKDHPHVPGLYNLLGVVEAQEGQYHAAESNFRKAVEEDPHFTGAYLNLGHLYQENASKDPDALRKALESYRKLLGFEPENSEANYQSAVLLERQGSVGASLEHLSRLPAAAQQRAQALAVRCADYAEAGDLSRAQSVATELLASPDLSEADVTSIFQALEKRKQDELEARLLEGLAQRGLASGGSLHRLVIVYERQGRLDQARATLEKVAEAQPALVQPLLELAHVANEQHDYKGALGYLAHARDLEPQNAGVHFSFGMVCVEENLVEEAYNSLRKAVDLESNNAYYNYALGAVALERDDPRQALPYFEKYHRLKPEDPRGRFALGAAYFYSHDDQAARRELGAAARYLKTAAGAHYFLGRIANQEGDLPTAVAELQQALEANPNNPDAHAELGLLRMKQKDYPEAEKLLQGALKIDPDNYTANLNLMILYQRMKDPRAKAQAQRFQQVRDKRAERAKEFLRTIEVQP